MTADPPSRLLQWGQSLLAGALGVAVGIAGFALTRDRQLQELQWRTEALERRQSAHEGLSTHSGTLERLEHLERAQAGFEERLKRCEEKRP